MVTYIRLSGPFQCWVYFSLKGSAASLARARYNIFWQKLFYIFWGIFLFFSSKIMQIKCQLKSCLSSSLFNTIHIYIIKNMLQNSHAFNWFIPSISKLSDFSIFDLHFTLQVIVLSLDFPWLWFSSNISCNSFECGMFLISFFSSECWHLWNVKARTEATNELDAAILFV